MQHSWRVAGRGSTDDYSLDGHGYGDCALDGFWQPAGLRSSFDGYAVRPGATGSFQT